MDDGSAPEDGESTFEFAATDDTCVDASFNADIYSNSNENGSDGSECSFEEAIVDEPCRKCAIKHGRFGRGLIGASSPEEAADILQKYLQAEPDNHGEINITTLTNTFETINLCLSAEQATLVLHGLQLHFNTWPRGDFRKFGLNKNQSRHGSSIILDLIGLKAAASSDTNVCSSCMSNNMFL